MKLLACGIVCVLAWSSSARADRCADGAGFAAKGNLPKAALYLENCDGEYAKVKASVNHKLDASKLSAMTIVTSPGGADATTDAMPGETFSTPATIWVKAGTYHVLVGNESTEVTLDAFSRRTVIINVAQPNPGAPKPGSVDFNEEEPEKPIDGPPPPQKFGPILPKRYRHPQPGSGGPALEDPLATPVDDGSLAWRLGARIGGGITQDGDAAMSVSGLARRPLAGPLSLAARLGWTHREIDAVALEVGLGVELASTSSFALIAGAGLRGEVRIQNQLAMEDVARVGVGAAASLDLALLNVPLVIGLRAEPAFTELTPGRHAHALLLELGYDFR